MYYVIDFIDTAHTACNFLRRMELIASSFKNNYFCLDKLIYFKN